MTQLCIGITTNRHLGDAVVLSAAIHDAKRTYPDVHFCYKGDYCDVFEGNNDFSICTKTDYDIDVRYTPLSLRKAEGGNLCEGVSRNLSRELESRLGKGFDSFTKVPSLFCTRKSIVSGKYVVINSNYQTCADIKGYPHWQELVDSRRDVMFVCIGANERRDVNISLTNVIDLRGRTSIQDLFALVRDAQCVISAPSGVVHIAAAFGVKSIVLCGARENVRLTDYPGAIHLSTSCGKYGKKYGCMRFHVDCVKGVPCDYPIIKREGRFAKCMCDIDTKEISECLTL